MTSEEYRYIIQIINDNAWERKVFLDIRFWLEQQGCSIQSIPYEDYLAFRNERIQQANQTTSLKDYKIHNARELPPPQIAMDVRDAAVQNRNKDYGFVSNNKDLIATFIAAGILIATGVFFPSISLLVWGLALCILAWGIKDVIPYPEHYDTDYVERYFRAQENARINTGAYLHQAYLHKSEIEYLYKSISKK